MPPLHWTSSGCSRAGGGPCDTQQQPLSSRSVDSKQEELASLASRDAFGQMKRTSMASRMYVESIKEEDTGLRGDSRLTHPLDARTYSPALKEVVELITMGKDTPAPVGSYRYLAFKYWGDIDVFEKIYLEKPSDVTARVFTAELQRIILNILNIQAASATYPKEPHRITQKAATAKLVHGVSFLELKCGLHPNTTLSSITGMGKWDYVGRKLVGYDGPHVYRQLSRLLAEGLLSEHVLRKAPCLDSRHSVEAQWSTTYKHWILSMGRAQSPSKLTSRVSSGGAAQRDRAMTEYEFFRQWVSSFPKLRWSPKEIIAGRKVLGNSNGLSMTLEEAVRYSQGEVKLDVAVSLPQGRIIEASVLWQVESEEGLLTKALNPYKESLNSDILKYAGGDKQDFYKTAKRMWSREVYNYYQHIYNDTKRTESLNVLWTLAKLFSSPAAAIARCITDLRTIDHALEARWRTRATLLNRDPIIRGLGYCQKLLLNNVPKMHRSTPQFTSKITSSLKLATAVLRIPATHGVDLVPKTDRRAAAIMESGGVACPWSALDDIIGEVVWEMVQDATVRALACITAVELDQTVVQSEVHHFLRDHRLLPTALRDVESVLDRAIEAFIETGGRDASILLDGYDGGGPGVRGLRIGRVYTILDVLWSGTRSVIFKCRLEDTPDRLSSGGGGGGQQHHQPVVVVQLVAVKVFYRPQTDGETSMIMNECKVHKYLSENIVTSSDLSRLEGGGGSNTPEGARDTRSAAAAPPPFPRWIHCGSTDSGLRYSVMDMFEGPTLEQELEDIIEGRRQPYSLGEAQGLMAALLSAVEAAHDVGVIHHNINPRSIVIMKGTNKGGPAKDDDHLQQQQQQQSSGVGPVPDWSSLLKIVGWASPEQIQRWAQQSSFGNSVMGIISTAQPAAAASPFPSPPDAVLPSPMDAHQRGAPPMSELAMDLYSCAVVLSQCYSAVRPRSAAAFCGGVPVTTAAAAAQHNPLMLTSSRASHLAHCSTPVTLEDHGLLRVKQLMEAHVQSLDEAQDQLARGVYGLEIVTSPMRAGGDIYRRLVVAIDKYRDTSAAELQSQKRDICPGYPQITSVLRQSLRPRSSDRPTSSCRGLRRLLSIAFDRDILRIIDTSARINRRVLRDSAPTLVS
ncbi:hypothetical protein FOL47_000827 [Perkinsus chesapeaki]|uniref:Protein kinase domain-containing protein n=1 Tax=Perkinsus chesapeaki TaxID=330153 RepID=A0A7J6ML53_PERCH|nr:hypothetical protein FOL47_000827 [Perkinsus chesapeaki]